MSKARKRLAILEVTSDVNKRVNVAAHNFSHHNYLHLGKVAYEDFDAALISVLDRSAAQTLYLMKKADAVIFGGGEDISPRFYGGEEEYFRRGQVFEDADEIQMDAAAIAIDRQIPILGICRGMQLLNVIAGGDLIQDIGPDNEHVHPRMFEENKMARTQITLTDSVISRALETTQFEAHCNHHQAIGRIANRFDVVGQSGDVVEAIEDDYTRIYGVQWHPEDRHASTKPLKKLLTLLDQD
jgi:putative glutamine amidotransferase